MGNHFSLLYLLKSGGADLSARLYPDRIDTARKCTDVEGDLIGASITLLRHAAYLYVLIVEQTSCDGARLR